MMGERSTPRRWLGGILAAYLLVALAYGWGTPPLESSDEYKHYPVVQHVQTTGRLVVLDPDNPGRWLQAGAQPPLYYMLMAAATSWIDTGDLADVHQENPHVYMGNAAQIKNKNLIIHRPAGETFPWSGTILAVMVIRFLSIGLGLGTIWSAYALGQRLFPSENQTVGLLAAALTAFNPMFLFISAAVNNDSLAALIGGLGLLALVRLWQESPDFRHGWRLYAWLGLLCGLGLLTKLSLGGLLALAGVITAVRAWQRRRPAILFQGGLLILMIALLLAVPWLARNWQLYGDLTGLAPFIAVQGTRDNPTLWGVDWAGEFGTFYRSFWGLFGGVNIFAPQWFYALSNGLFLAGMIGLGWRWRQRRLPAAAWLPAALVAILFVLLVRWTIISPAFQGRLLFPGLSGINVLWAAGLLALVPAAARRPASQLTAVSYLLIAAFLPFTHISPAYAYPEPLAAVPPEAAFGPIRFENESEDGAALLLVGVELPPGQVVTPGGREPVEVVLYWQVEDPLAADLVTAVHLLGRELDSVGQVDRYPGWGMWPTSRWAAGEIYRDPYRIWPRENAAAPARLQLDVSVADTANGAEWIPRGPDGAPLALVLVGEAKLAPPPDGPPAAVPGTELGVEWAEGIRLKGVDAPAAAAAGETVDLVLTWEATGTPNRNYTVFVQLLDENGEYLAGGDAPPLDGDYPTGLWAAGETIVDPKRLPIPADLPPGDSYRIVVGLYDPATGARLPRLDGGDAAVIPLIIR